MPENLGSIGRVLVMAGAVLVALGIVVLVFDRVPGGNGPGLGRLPGDFIIRRGNFTLYMPLGTGLLISLLASLLFGLFGKR
jgi:hypothetical protein